MQGATVSGGDDRLNGAERVVISGLTLSAFTAPDVLLRQRRTALLPSPA